MRVKLKEIVEKVIDNRGKTPILTKTKTNYCLIEAQCFSVKTHIYKSDAVKFVDRETFNSFRSGTCCYGDILVTLVGNIGQTAFIHDNVCIAQNIVALRFNNLTTAKYLFYFMQNKYFKSKCEQLNRSSVQPSINVNDFLDLEINLPSLEKQNKIAKILSNIDDQIERNNTMVKRLQDLAQTTYSRWFNQFEFPNEEGKPYKSSGGKLVYNDKLKKEIPVNWRVGNLYDIADFINGLACQKYRPITEDKLPIIKITEMHNGYTDVTEYAMKEVDNKYIINAGDILFSWSATLETQVWTREQGVLNQHIFKVIPLKYGKSYTYLQLSAYIINFIKMAEGRKTTMGHITTEHLKQSLIVLPSNDIENKFSQVFNQLLKIEVKIQKETLLLNKMKEQLLPLLINGQLA